MEPFRKSMYRTFADVQKTQTLSITPRTFFPILNISKLVDSISIKKTHSNNSMYLLQHQLNKIYVRNTQFLGFTCFSWKW